MIEGPPLLFGEVLFDCFNDGEIALGGAPFNVAWHLQGLGVTPLLVTRVGSDQRGSVVLRLMQERGMPVAGVQLDPERPTGVVAVQLKAGEPEYNILPEQAYDYIDTSQALACLQTARPGLIYHGSLALRSAVSRAALAHLLAESALPAFLDLNIREPWWDAAQTIPLLRRATWVKLNASELDCAMHGRFEDLAAQQQAAQELFVQCELQMLVVSRGAEGGFMVLPEGIVEGRPAPAGTVVDTVGAGDAFSAVLIAGLLRGEAPQAMLDRAIAVAAGVCRHRGATPEDSTLYRLDAAG